MIRTLLCLLISISSCSVFAKSSTRAKFLVAAGVQTFLEQDEIESQYAGRVAFSPRIGIGLRSGDIFLEGGWLSNEASEGALSVKRKQTFGLLWYRYHLPALEHGEIVPFIGAALGAHFETVTTTIGSDVSDATGKPLLVAAASTGILWIVGEIFELGADFRVLASERFRPNPTVGASASLGFRF